MWITITDMRKALFILLSLLLCFALVSCATVTEGEVADSGLSREGYTLDKVVILSRHNIRSPLSGEGSVLDSITPYTWHKWSSDTSQLSLLGGSLEVQMGQFFRKWLESEKLISTNCMPDGNVRIYSNSKQRTIATARFFSAGLFPVSDVPVEYHMAFDLMDPVFTPQLTFTSPAYEQAVRNQISELFSDDIASLATAYELTAEVIDFYRSEAYTSGTVAPFTTDDTEILLRLYAEPAVSGSLKTACQISDALVLQFFEQPDDRKAAFGKKLSLSQWEEISRIKDVYEDVLFTAPLVAVNVAHPLLCELLGEMKDNTRIISFLCGHDSNVCSVLAALDVEPYSLENTVEKKTPIGCKVVFSRWKDSAGRFFWSADMVYQSTDQLRGNTILDMDNPPQVFSLHFKGLEETGLYAEEAFFRHFEGAVAEYEKVLSTFLNDNL